eukprot:jgi/Ulvmu1/746/UM010_0119.1
MRAATPATAAAAAGTVAASALVYVVDTSGFLCGTAQGASYAHDRILVRATCSMRASALPPAPAAALGDALASTDEEGDGAEGEGPEDGEGELDADVGAGRKTRGHWQVRGGGHAGGGAAGTRPGCGPRQPCLL